MDYNPSRIDMRELFVQSTAMLRERVMEHWLRLSVYVAEIPAVITADERKMKQILYNLLANAVKFTPDGGSISLTSRMCEIIGGKLELRDGRLIELPARRNNGRSYLEVSIRYTGIGIDKNDQEIIFNPFEQVDGALNRRFQGIVLGLSLCRELVELHGGIIWVESGGKDMGSTFRFVIPAE